MTLVELGRELENLTGRTIKIQQVILNESLHICLTLNQIQIHL